MTYRPRIVDAELIDRLRTRGAVVIEGAKATGKTATASRHAASIVLLDVDDAARNAAAIDPTLLLAGATPRLIDEWHIEPALWNHVRREVDARAAVLSVSRPFLIKLLDEGAIPHRKVGTHRRIRMDDVMSYKTRIDREREAVLEELTREAQEQGYGY